MAARIMIVEDQGIIAEDLKFRVEALGHHVIAKVRSAEEALRIADAERPDLVLMDIVLAGEMDGIEAAEIMRSTSTIAVVFISSHVDDERLKRVKPTQPYGYILKPFSGRDLKLTIEMALHVSQVEEERRLAEKQQRRLLRDVQHHQEELRCQNEELRIAQEELKCQNEELKKAQEELSASRDRFRDLFDNAPVGFATSDRKGRLCEANLTLCTMLGRERSELIGQPLSVFMVEDDQDACYLHLQAARAGSGSQQPASCELQMRGKDSVPFWVRLETTPVCDEETVLRTAVSDITERKRGEHERRLFEQRVQQAHRMESLGVLAGGVAHDFNNMLGAISGNADLILDAAEPGSEICRFAEQQLVACARAADMVEQILTFSRRAERDRGVVDFRVVVRETLQLLSTTLPASIVVESDIEHDAPWVLADLTQLHQVIMNLCINAKFAMRDSGGVLRVELSIHCVGADQAAAIPQALEGEYAHLAVSDTGTGVKPEIIERIFEPFFTTKETGQGSGMGLATCHGIVASHGGFMTVESEPGRGATFHVFLPTAERAVEPGPPKAPNPPSLGQGKVLLVDDEAMLLDMASHMLRSLGYSVTAVTSGDEALQELRTAPDDWSLLITDQTMSGMSGIEILGAVRTLRPDLPVVIMTGHSDKLTDDADGGVGADAILRKPFRRGILAETLRGVTGIGLTGAPER